jgi:hypothetical protein
MYLASLLSTTSTLRGVDDPGRVQRIICGVNGFFSTSY